jgi:hypothetical protein
LASKTMFNSEPEPLGHTNGRGEVLQIAREHSGFVPQSEDRNVVVRAVCYITQVHAFSYQRDDTRWFHQTLTVLLELAHPGEIPGPAGEPFLTDIEAGIRRARSRFT